MNKWISAAVLVLVVVSGIAWKSGQRDAYTEPSLDASHSDPYSSGAAQRHFTGQPTHWVSMVLVTN